MRHVSSPSRPSSAASSPSIAHLNAALRNVRATIPDPDDRQHRAHAQRNQDRAGPIASPFNTRVISVFCASAGIHSCQGASAPGFKTVTSGSSETTSTTTVGTGLGFLECPAADRDRHQHRRQRGCERQQHDEEQQASRGPYRNSAAKVSLRSSHWAGMKLSELSTAISMLMPETAPHFPTTSAQRSAGFISSGSSDPRSRSPAVVSSAAFSAPYSTAIITKNGSMPVNCVARLCGFARSRVSTCTGSSNSFDTPRSARPIVDRSRLNPASSRSMRRALDCERWLELSETSSITRPVAAHQRGFEIGGHDDHRIRQARALRNAAS